MTNNAGSNNTTGTDSAAATAAGAKKYKMVLFDKAEWQFSEREKEAIEVSDNPIQSFSMMYCKTKSFYKQSTFYVEWHYLL